MNSSVFTSIVTFLFKNRCFSLFAAFIASAFLLLMSFCVPSSRLTSSLQSHWRLHNLIEVLLYPSWKIAFCSYHIWLQFSHQAGFGSNVVRLDSGHFWGLKLLFYSVYCWTLCLKGVDIRFHPLILFFLLLA